VSVQQFKIEFKKARRKRDQVLLFAGKFQPPSLHETTLLSVAASSRAVAFALDGPRRWTAPEPVQRTPPTPLRLLCHLQ